jgi:hypothetical protein
LTTDIFLSVGHALTPEQESFVQAVAALLRAHNLSPRTVGRTDFTDRQPLKRVDEVLRLCSGTIVVALKRIHICEGRELRSALGTQQLRDVGLPTVWNQIEAAMAYSLGQPLLAIVEKDLRSEGVLEAGYDWYVDWLDLRPHSLVEPGFQRIFEGWKANVLKYRQRLSQLAPSDFSWTGTTF